MTKPELQRRMNTCDPNNFLRAVRMVRAGYGARGITLECPVTLKEANAAFEWVRRYGFINPPDRSVIR